MKKIIITLAALALLCASASAFTTREHATVAYIAEQHLKPATKKKLAKILHNQHLTEFSSWPDFYRMAMKSPDGKQIGHMYKVDENFYPVDRDVHKSAYNAVKEAAERLRHYKDYNDSTVLADMSVVVHLMGDLHCPSHITYADERHKKIKEINYVMYFGKKATKPRKIKYHAFWDSWCMDQRYSGGYMELADIFDIKTAKEIKEIQKGTLEDWIHDSAETCKEIYDVEDKALVDRIYVIDKAAIARDQITKAGYRLAALLNDIF